MGLADFTKLEQDLALTISATVLGELAQPGYCPRCFWVKQKSRRLPYQSFPGIFSSIDRYVKRMARHHFDLEGKLPAVAGGSAVALELRRYSGRPVGVGGRGVGEDAAVQNKTHATADQRTSLL